MSCKVQKTFKKKTNAKKFAKALRKRTRSKHVRTSKRKKGWAVSTCSK